MADGVRMRWRELVVKERGQRKARVVSKNNQEVKKGRLLCNDEADVPSLWLFRPAPQNRRCHYSGEARLPLPLSLA